MAATHASRAEGSSSLIDSLQRNKDEEEKIKARHNELNPRNDIFGKAESLKSKAQYFANYSYGKDYGQNAADHLRPTARRTISRWSATPRFKTSSRGKSPARSVTRLGP